MKIKNFRTGLSLALCLAMSSGFAFADEEKSYRLDSSVVTAGGFEQDYTLAPASISVVSPKEIQTRPVRDLAEALANVPGVDIDSGTTKTGGYGISIRGMGSSYTLILVDGKRINADGSLFPNGFGDSVSSFMPPMGAIERIEVIRGPASTLYGSDAIGGVVNIITKKNPDKWSTSVGYDYTYQTKKWFGNTQKISLYAAGPIIENFSAVLRGSIYTRDGVPVSDLKVNDSHTGVQGTGSKGSNSNTGLTAGQVVGSAPGKIYNIGSRWTYNFNDENRVYLDLDYSEQNYDNSQGLVMSNRGTFSPSYSSYELQRNSGYSHKYNIYRGNVVLAYDGKIEIGKEDDALSAIFLDSSLTYNHTVNAGRYVTDTAATQFTTQEWYNGVKRGHSRELTQKDWIFDIKANAPLNFSDNFGMNPTIGARYWRNAFHDQLLAVSSGSADVDQDILAFFVENEFMFANKWFLTLGVRSNYSSIFGDNLSPRIYLSYDAIEDGWLTFKGGVSTGYKSPALNQLVSGIASFSGSGTNPTYGNPNLKPETSVNYEVSALSDNEFFSAGITGFYITFKDKITQTGGLSGKINDGMTIPTTGQICVAPSGSCSYYTNASRAKSFGAEVSLALKPLKLGVGHVSLGANYTFNDTRITDAIDKSDIGSKFNDVPLHSFNAYANYDLANYGFFVRGEWKSGIYRGDPSEANTAASVQGEYYDPYVLVHTGGYYKFNDNFKINLAIYNLFDKNFIDYEEYYGKSRGKVSTTPSYANAYNYIREGRRFYLSAQYDY